MERLIAKQPLRDEPALQAGNIDALTGLFTRIYLQTEITDFLARPRDKTEEFSLFCVALDCFKTINRNFGQYVGDLVLVQVAERLHICCRDATTVTRIGGDEFAACVYGRTDEATLTVECHNILDAMRAPFVILGKHIHLTCSIGVATLPLEQVNDAFSLFNLADIALQKAKDRGGDNCQFLSAKSLDANRQTPDMIAALRSAIEAEELTLRYQPLVDLQTGAISGVEALVRWIGASNESIPTAYFIDIAENSGLIVDIGNWVIRRACHDLRRWADEGLGHYSVAINISPKQFHDPALAETISAALQEAQIAPSLLCVEITEAVLVQDHPSTLSTLNKLMALGIGLILDDFGTGFSSLSYLKRFPFLKVKIDRSFIKNIPEDNNDAAISKAIISMAHSLGIRVVAEGVETEAQCSFLSQNMCDEIQGFLFSDALVADEIDRLLKEGRCLPAKLLRLQKPQRTLLLVDDEANIIGALKRLLRKGDYRILTANNGQGGLDLLAEHPVDVIVSDQRMPGMTGVEFLGKAKELYPDTVRIVLSGYTELHSVTDAVNEGAIYKFLTKPWDDEQLYGHIEEAFRRKEMADENRRLNLEVLSANQELALANHRLEEILKEKQLQIVRDEVSLDIVREALQKIPLAVIGVDDENIVVFANDAAQNLFDDTHSILGSDVHQLIPDYINATPNSNRGMQCIAELGGKFYEVVARRMGRGSQSRGRLLTISPHRAIP